MTNFKLYLLLLLTTIIPTIAAAQSGTLKAKILDAEAPDLPIAGAIIELAPTSSPDAKVYYSTDGGGVFNTAQLPYGEYMLNVSFLGYQNDIRTVTVSKAETLLSDIVLSPSSVQMEAVVKEVKALRSSQKGDTLNYNASAFKVAADADVEGLLSKMPGISIEDGEVTAQGEEVKKIYIDGREFFGNDVATALKSLPAEIVSRIEVYDKLSDEAEYSGMDDGQGEKTINIVTHETMRQGAFGKIYAGGGYEPDSNIGDDPGKYVIGGSVNVFHGTSRFTVIGLSNNINQQNFSFEDVMGVSDDSSSSSSSFMIKQLPGVAKVNAVGLNYSDVFGKDDKVKVQGSYFFNHTKTTNIESMIKWYETDDESTSIDSLYRTIDSYTDNINHRLNGRIDWKISKRQSLMIRPSLSIQSNDPYKTTSGTRYGENYSYGYQDYGSISDYRWGGYNVTTSANYRLNLGTNRNLTLGGTVSINNYESTGEVETLPNQPNSNADATSSYQYNANPTNRRNLSGNVGYTEPITPNWILNLTYKVTESYQETDKKSYDTESDYIYTPENENTSSSSLTTSKYVTHKVGPGIRFMKKKSNLVASVAYQLSDLETATYKEDATSYNTPTYKNILYSLVGQAYFNPQNSLRIYLNSSTTNPAISRLQDIYTISGDYISKGNSDLTPTYTTNLKFRYIHSNLEKGSTLMWMLSAQKTNDYIASHIVVTPNTYYIEDVEYADTEQYTTWVNLKEYWSFGTHLDYGFPVDFIKCNLNFKLGVNYSLTPSIFGGEVQDDGTIIGGAETETGKMTYSVGTVLGSNISENVDFTLQWHGKFYEADNAATSIETISTNQYFDQSASAALKVVFGGGFTFTANVVYKQYLGITNNYNDQYTVCNAFIGRKIFKSKRGEINVGINDALDQSTSISRYVGTNYSQNTTNITMGRYYSAQFIYNLRYFGRKASTKASDYEGMDRYINNTSGSSNKSQRGPGGQRY
ncbi:MAG: carboxypeptidase-like regulatory domain-containing protein [Rikenellaceae bacterium]